MVAGTGVRIEGLKEFNRALKRVSKELPKITRLVHKEMSMDVSRVAGANARVLPGGRLFSGLIKTSAGINFAAVRFKASHPAAAGWIFGSHQYGQFLSWVGNQSTGNYGDDIYGSFGPEAYAVAPALRLVVPRLQAEYWRRMQRAFRGAFPK